MTIGTLGERHENDWQDAQLNAYLTVNALVMQVMTAVHARESKH